MVKGNLNFIDDYSRGFHQNLIANNSDLYLVIDGPYKLPSIAVLTKTAYAILQQYTAEDKIWLPPAPLIDAASAAYLTNEFIGSLDLNAYLSKLS